MSKQLIFSFQVDETFLEGINRLQPILGFTRGESGITVTARQADCPGVSVKDGKAEIRYTKKHMFFRELGVLCENIKTKTEFCIEEDNCFDTVSVMIDTSRCAVPTVNSINKMMDYLAVMGYSMAMLYTEDTVELEKYPYFGYMRGRYTPQELKAVDDYAYEYGIEIIPCLECYGHMEKYLMWSEAGPIKDTAGVLLAREEKTFVFIEELIKTVSSCFRSKRIHIGMDEAWDMGRGEFLNKHGYVHPFEIFTEYMDRLIAITNKYGLIPMMWSDMYFRMATKNNAYYDASIEIPSEVANKIPKEVELVFWHYGEKPFCDDYMLEKHAALGRNIIFSGGLWSWIGHFPEHNYMAETSRFSLAACRKHNVREVLMTAWFNDNAECDLFATLYGLSYFAELCYDKDLTDEKFTSRFENCTGGNAKAFYTMSMYHNQFDAENDYSANFHTRFLGKPLFWQDIMEGLYDTHLYEKPMSGHYAACAQQMKEYNDGPWASLYDFAYRVFEYLAVKTRIAENLVPAYKRGDREMLVTIVKDLLPLLKEKTIAVHTAHKALWFASLKVVGWGNMDIRYGGMASRCDTAKELIERYLDGKDDVIEELEVERLHKPLGGFIRYAAISSPNLRI